MELIVDTRQHDGKHERKHNQLIERGYSLTFRKLDHGDYMLPAGRVSIDTKENLSEIWGNLRGSHKDKKTGKKIRNYPRFRAECIRAKDAGHVLVVLIENCYGIHGLYELSHWSEGEHSFNKRKFAKQKMNGESLAKQMMTMSKEYGVLWAFCHPSQTGNKIAECLTRESELLALQKDVLDNE
jgi:hypothetical protein